MPTIKDVAKASGVSTTAVSFVLNGTGVVGKEASARVLQAARELGYQADPLARAMITRRTLSLGVLVNNVHSFTASSILSGIEQTARRSGYEILLALHRDDPQTALSALRDLTARRIDALVSVFAKTDECPPVTQALSATGLPYTIAFHRAQIGEIIDNIVPDQEQGALLATQHLLDNRRRTIAFAGGPSTRNATQERLRGYHRAHAERGLVPDPRWIVFNEFTVQAGLEMAEQILQSREQRPDAVVAADDNIAAGLLRACRAKNLRVPNDVAVVGYNDGPLCEAVDPPLTSVRMPLGDVGRLCVERMIARLEHPAEWQPATLTLPCRLVLRQSA